MVYFVLINYDLIVKLYSNSFCNIFLSNGVVGCMFYGHAISCLFLSVLG